MLPQIKAEFCITGIKISPMEITNLIGINPTKTWNAGELIQKTKLKRKFNGWCLSTSESTTLDITDSVKYLLETILPKADVINQITRIYDLRCELCFVAYILDETPVINFDTDIVHGLSRLNATIDIDIILSQP